MPILLPPEPPMSADFPGRKRFTRDEVKFLVDNNILTERYELIDGEILIKMQNPPHNTFLIFVAVCLEQIFGRLYVRTQQTIEVSDADCPTNNPEPDITVTAHSALEYAHRHPEPNEILLLVEIADSTLIPDRTAKAVLYSRARIVEYWVADVKKRQIIVHREPTDNDYTAVSVYSAEEEISSLARPDAKIRVNDLFPPDVSSNEE